MLPEEGRSNLPDLGGPGHVKRGNCRSGPLDLDEEAPETGETRGLLRFLTGGTVMGREYPSQSNDLIVRFGESMHGGWR